MQYFHDPVMLDETLEYLNLKRNNNYVDCTLGLAGHTKAILRKNGPKGKVLAIDQDPKGINEAKKLLEKYKNRVTFSHNNFRDLNKVIGDTNFGRISGMLLDLGLASWQISDSERGISFSTNMPLDMRMNPDSILTAKEIVNKYPEKKLANLLYNLGDIYKSRSIAKKIVSERVKNPINNTVDLVSIIGTNNPKILAPIFQALRIEVNEELESLNEVLPQAYESMKKGGRLVIISYHSGEDRIVKNYFRSNKDKWKILTKKPINATDKEISINPRARSAKLRAGEKI